MQTYIVIDGSLDCVATIIADLAGLTRFRAIADPMRYIIEPMLRPEFVVESPLGSVFSCFGRFYVDYPPVLEPRQRGEAALSSGSIGATAPMERLTALSTARIVNNKMVVGRKVVGRRMCDPDDVRTLEGSWRPGYILGVEILVFHSDVMIIRGRNDVKLPLAMRIRRMFK